MRRPLCHGHPRPGVEHSIRLSAAGAVPRTCFRKREWRNLRTLPECKAFGGHAGGDAQAAHRLLGPTFDGPEANASPVADASATADPPVLDSLTPRRRHGCLDRIWVEADYLLWWMKGDSLPPLVTTSPPGTIRNQAGVLGSPGTTTLFGDSHTNGELRSGGMITFGYWFDDCRTCGIEANFLMLESRNTGFNAASNGSTILARPFFDVVAGQQRSELIGFPGLVAGHVNVSDTSTGLLRAGAWFRQNLCAGCNPCSSYRVDMLAGYRYLRLTDNLTIGEDLVSINPNNPNFVPVGTSLVVTDQFGTTNNFHGFDIGLTGEIQRGRWVFGWLTKVAVGVTFEEVDINGSTRVTVPGAAPVANVGGLLALPSNIGTYNRERFAVVPELGAWLGYQVTPRLRFTAGYNFLFWSEVVRAGNQIDTSINPNLLPPANGPVAGALRPAANIQGTSFWAQGISLGLQFNY